MRKPVLWRQVWRYGGEGLLRGSGEAGLSQNIEGDDRAALITVSDE